MSTENSELQIDDNTADSRYTVTRDGESVGVAEYERSGGTITFTHTVVDEEAEGQGVGSALIQYALDEAREQKLTVVPECRFVASFISDHPEYQDLVG